MRLPPSALIRPRPESSQLRFASARQLRFSALTLQPFRRAPASFRQQSGIGSERSQPAPASPWQLTTDNGQLTREARKQIPDAQNGRHTRHDLTPLGLTAWRVNNRNPKFLAYIMTTHDIRACRVNNRNAVATRS